MQIRFLSSILEQMATDFGKELEKMGSLTEKFEQAQQKFSKEDDFRMDWQGRLKIYLL